MGNKRIWVIPVIYNAAIVGMGVVSGKGILRFFSGYGLFSWLGIVLCSCLVGAASTRLCHLTSNAKIQTYKELCKILFGQTGGRIAGGCFLVLQLIIVMLMLCAAGTWGLLWHDKGYLLGILCIGSVCVILARQDIALLAKISAGVLPAIVLFYVVLFYFGKDESMEIAHMTRAHLPTSLLQCGLYAALILCQTVTVVCQYAHGMTSAQAIHVGIASGFSVGILFSSANLALLPFQKALQAAPLPTAALAYSVGLWGQITYSALWGLAIMTTLCTALRALFNELQVHV